MGSYSGQKAPPDQKSALDGERITSANQLTSPLKRLPAELRNAIYRYMFAGRSIELIYPPHYIGDRGPRSKHSADIAALLLSCRQIYNESYELYISNATFRLAHVRIEYFTKFYDPAKRALVTSIICGSDDLYSSCGKVRQGALVALKRVHLVMGWPAPIAKESVQRLLDYVTGGRIRVDEVEVTTSRDHRVV